MAPLGGRFAAPTLAHRYAASWAIHTINGATWLIVADSLEGEGGPWPRWGRASPLNGERLFAFTRLDPSQWRSALTTNAIERLNEEFRRRIKTQTVLPCAETVPMLL